MLSHSLARLTAGLPSSLKYRLSTFKPFFNGLMRLGQPLVQAKTIAGEVNWTIDPLTSQQFVLGTYELYMQEAFRKFVRPGATVYDVGAHAGYHSLVCALLVGPSGRVIAFEPNPQNRQSIERQLSLNPTLNVTVAPYALSDRCATLAFDASPGTSEGRVTEEGDLKVEARTIDYLVKEEGFPTPDVIKIDVEGHEENVLLGTLETIDKHEPVILCDRNDDDTYAKVSALLAPCGYDVIDGSPITAVFRSAASESQKAVQ